MCKLNECSAFLQIMQLMLFHQLQFIHFWFFAFIVRFLHLSMKSKQKELYPHTLLSDDGRIAASLHS